MMLLAPGFGLVVSANKSHSIPLNCAVNSRHSPLRVMHSISLLSAFVKSTGTRPSLPFIFDVSTASIVLIICWSYNNV